MSREDSGVNGTTPEEIEADIARQREELAATVTELHARLDLKARTRAKAAELRGRATTPDGKPNPRVVAAAVAVVLVVAGVAFRRRRH